MRQILFLLLIIVSFYHNGLAQNYIRITAVYQNPDKAYIKCASSSMGYSQSKEIIVPKGLITYELNLNEEISDLIKTQIYFSLKNENIVRIDKIEIRIKEHSFIVTGENFSEFFNVNQFVQISKNDSGIVLKTSRINNKYYPYIYLNDTFLNLIKNEKKTFNSLSLLTQGSFVSCRIYYDALNSWKQRDYNKSLIKVSNNDGFTRYEFYSDFLTKKLLIEFNIIAGDTVFIDDIILNDITYSEKKIWRTECDHYNGFLTNECNKLFIDVKYDPNEEYDTIKFINLRSSGELFISPRYDYAVESLQPPYRLGSKGNLLVRSNSSIVGLDITAFANFSFDQIHIKSLSNDFVLDSEYKLRKYFRFNNLLLENVDSKFSFVLFDGEEVGRLNYNSTQFEIPIIRYKQITYFIISLLLLITFQRRLLSLVNLHFS